MSRLCNLHGPQGACASSADTRQTIGDDHARRMLQLFRRPPPRSRRRGGVGPFRRGIRPVGRDERQRHALDVPLDARVAHAYGLAAAQYEAVLDAFEVMARMQTRADGRYKFKDDCLEAYRRLA